MLVLCILQSVYIPSLFQHDVIEVLVLHDVWRHFSPSQLKTKTLNLPNLTITPLLYCSSNLKTLFSHVSLAGINIGLIYWMICGISRTASLSNPPCWFGVSLIFHTFIWHKNKMLRFVVTCSIIFCTHYASMCKFLRWTGFSECQTDKFLLRASKLQWFYTPTEMLRSYWSKNENTSLLLASIANMAVTWPTNLHVFWTEFETVKRLVVTT